MRRVTIALLFLALGLGSRPAFAQGGSIEFNRWDAQITATSNSDQMQVSEVQEIHVTGGKISQGSRFWTTPIQLQNVFFVAGNNGQPQELTQGSNNQPGTYTLKQSGNQTTVDYVLPTAQASGSTFI